MTGPLAPRGEPAHPSAAAGSVAPMTPFDPEIHDPDTTIIMPPLEADDEFPARRLLAHDADDTWLEDEFDGWRPID